jgi:hypothetical protein
LLVFIALSLTIHFNPHFRNVIITALKEIVIIGAAAVLVVMVGLVDLKIVWIVNAEVRVYLMYNLFLFSYFFLPLIHRRRLRVWKKFFFFVWWRKVITFSVSVQVSFLCVVVVILSIRKKHFEKVTVKEEIVIFMENLILIFRVSFLREKCFIFVPWSYVTIFEESIFQKKLKWIKKFSLR